MIQLLLNKTTPHFQLLPMSKVDQSELRIHEVPPLQLAKSLLIHQEIIFDTEFMLGYGGGRRIMVYAPFPQWL